MSLLLCSHHSNARDGYKDGVDNYYIKERSLGFKWFFTFLLFTQFRVSRTSGEGLIFLFDEPASNLHSTAQQRLVTALEKLTENGSQVVYTTHSHHLINPHWLEGAFIVKNKALNYDDDCDDEYDMSETDISIERYRSFVGKYPNQKTYFQPILDVLEYRPK
jgi:predicted ATPase